VNSTVKRMMQNIKRERLMSTSNILVMFVTFMVLGVFLYVIALSQTAFRYLENQAQVTVFFKDDFVEKNILELKDKYVADKRISEIKYVSKEDAFKIFSEINKNEPALLESISASILPASLEVKAKRISDLSSLAEEFSKIDGVEEVRFFKEVIETFRFWSTTAYIIGFILVGIFMLISYSIVISTIRTTISSKGAELEIMKLVGATDDYVKSPLIYQGVTFGFVSSLAAGIVFVFISAVASFFKVLSFGITFGFLHGLFLHPIVFSVFLLLFLLTSGCLLGYLGSYTAVSKYLKY